MCPIFNKNFWPNPPDRALATPANLIPDSDTSACYIGISPMQIEKVYEPQRFEPHWAQWWIDSGIFRAIRQRRRTRILARHSAAQRDRLAAHRPHARAHRDRRHRPLASHARRQHPLAARHRPRRHRHPDGGRAPSSPKKASTAATSAAKNSKSASGSGKSESGDTIKRQMIRLGASLRLVARALHPRPGPLPRRPRGLRPPLRKGPHLPRRVHGQLVPALPHRHLRSRSRPRRVAGPPLAHPLSGERHAGPLPDRRHHASRDHARRHRRRHQPEGRALSRPARQDRAACR